LNQELCDTSEEQEKAMRTSLRDVVVDSHVAAAAIASLLFFSLGDIFRALWALLAPVSQVIAFLLTAVAIQGIPYFSRELDVVTRLQLEIMLSLLSSALISFASAWVLSRWAYGAGPIRSLRTCCNTLRRRNHA
jgi:hypothetical protein